MIGVHVSKNRGQLSSTLLVQSRPMNVFIRVKPSIDVAVITDHNAYQASIEALAECDRLGLNLITMPGEEVSGPNWHILSIAAAASICRARESITSVLVILYASHVGVECR